MNKPAFELKMPACRDTSVVFASPHSGRDYSWQFQRRSVLDERIIRSSEDAFVDLLFEDVPKFGAPLINATFPRAFVDLNRSADELDPALIEGAKKSGFNPRVVSGLGVVPRVVANGRAIYRGKLTLKEAHARISEYWRPYHDKLHSLLGENRRLFGEAILIDCHSMPHESLDALERSGAERPDVVLGDRFGSSADARITDLIEAAFVVEGFKVARNVPFAGAYITQHYGRVSSGQHAVQIEIDRSLYMNETLIRPNGNFDTMRARITAVAAKIAEIGRQETQLAAE